MRFSQLFRAALAIAFGCTFALLSAQSSAAEYEKCKSGDEPNVTCQFGLGAWGCDGPCKPATVAIFTAPSGYQVCKPLITRRDIKGGECYFFQSMPTELQLHCSAPSAETHARVHEVTIYSVAANAPKPLWDKYECVKW